MPPKAPDYKRLTRAWATPWLEFSYYGMGSPRLQQQYGRAICQMGAEACLTFLMDYPPEEKELSSSATSNTASTCTAS